MRRQADPVQGRAVIARALFLAALIVAAPATAQLPQDSPPAQPAAEKPVQVVDSLLSVHRLDPENLWHLDLSTGGRVTIRLRPDVAPAHVERIKALTRRGFYNGVTFHRVIEGFMAQGGDPKGSGEGGSDLPDLKAEFNELPHVRGAVSMARTEDKDSANSQFFIMFQPLLRLDRNYTVIGRVVDGMQWVDAIPRGEPPPEPARILQASIGADNRPPPVFPTQARPAIDPAAAEAARLLQGGQPPR